MDIGLWLAAAALVLLSGLLLAGLSLLGQLGEKFALLDREQFLPRLRAILLGATGLAMAATLGVGILAIVALVAPSPMPGSVPPATVTKAVTKPASKAAPPAAVRESAPAPEPAPPSKPEPVAQPVPEPKPASQPVVPRGWHRARIVSSGEVTLRAWPNGSAVSQLYPNDVVLTEDEEKDAGGHRWVKVRVPDGRSGWVVRRFVQGE